MVRSASQHSADSGSYGCTRGGEEELGTRQVHESLQKQTLKGIETSGYTHYGLDQGIALAL